MWISIATPRPSDRVFKDAEASSGISGVQGLGFAMSEDMLDWKCSRSLLRYLLGWVLFMSVRQVEVAYGKNENSGKPNAFGEHSQRFKPEEAPTLLSGSGPAGSAAEKPTEV